MAWAGFSEEELQKLQGNQGPTKRGSGQTNNIKGKTSGQMAKARPQRAVQPIKKQTEPPVSDLPSAARLSVSSASSTTITTPTNTTIPSMPTDQSAIHSKQPTSELDKSPISPVTTKSLELLDDSAGISRELNSLEHYQQQQKMMEELNKKKKQMLAKALAERTKQASAETTKLKTIQKELSHLDQMLNVDVSVIRDRIEDATQLYSDASRRYELAEREYIEAKINLHKRSELKEQLTEHLYTIIHQNEIRKAKKLAELMEQLEMTAQEETCTSDLPDLPSYSLLGSIQSVGSGNLAPNKTLSSPTSQKILPSATEHDSIPVSTAEDKAQKDSVDGGDNPLLDTGDKDHHVTENDHQVPDSAPS